MSLLVPDERDRFDAYGYQDHNDIYFSQDRPGWQFEAISGFFQQSEPSTNDMKFNYDMQDFGALDSWPVLMEKLVRLNTESSHCKYKLLLLARHGEGYHNVANAKYRDSWFDKWRFLETDGEMVWGDADLTDLGKAQAKQNQRFIKTQLSKGMPIPTKFYVSPLKRALKTMTVEWDGVNIPKAEITDGVRETIGINLCHRRSSKTEISKYAVEFPAGFTEQDELFDSYKERELYWQQFMRVNKFLQEVFEGDDEVLSVTCHAGTIRAFLTVIKHRAFTIPTGGMIPVIIKASQS